jgi:hypothetical protein
MCLKLLLISQILSVWGISTGSNKDIVYAIQASFKHKDSAAVLVKLFKIMIIFMVAETQFSTQTVFGISVTVLNTCSIWDICNSFLHSILDISNSFSHRQYLGYQ